MINEKTKIENTSHRVSVAIPRLNEMEWETVAFYGGVPGPAKKILSIGTGGALSSDPDVEMATFVSHMPPWWCDPELVYHPCVEEVLILNGAVQLADRYYGPGSYIYRPPGILHGPASAPSDTGATLFHRFVAEGGILRYSGNEFPHVDCQAITDEYKIWPTPWVEHLDAETLPGVEVGFGPWQGTLCKWLSRNRETGGGTILIEIPPGWRGAGSSPRGTVEEFVVSGSLTMGGQYFDRWGYACRTPGQAAGEYASQGGARLICIWDEDELSG